MRFSAPDYFQVHQALKHKGVTLQLLWAEYVEAHGDKAYRYSQFCQHYRTWRDRQRRTQVTCMHDALAHQLTQPDTYDLPFEDRLGMLLDREVLHRDNRRLDRLLKAAKLRITTCEDTSTTAIPAAWSGVVWRR